nr:PREDICTED: uncharacterized protein LOC100879944 isoform X4 [Megachile rotundata]
MDPLGLRGSFNQLQPGCVQRLLAKLRCKRNLFASAGLQRVQQPAAYQVELLPHQACMGGFSLGCGLGWSAPVVELLKSKYKYDVFSTNVVASVFPLGAALGLITVPFLIDKIGRKWTMMVLVPPFVLGWIFIASSVSVMGLMVTGRLITGACGGMFCVAAPMYTAEICEKQIRGESSTNSPIEDRDRDKINGIHMEDEGNHGNDDTRCFILSTLAALQWSRVSCVLCRSPMLVFDRYPLVDGTFFLSPRQHSPACAEVKVEGRTQFLSAVCMSCLEGSGGQPVRCRCCTQPWDGSSLVLGTMYSYDIFAAMPCCTERLKCNSCQKPLIYPHQRLNFYSDYSRVFACPHCRAVDAHFVKPLSICFTREQFQLYSQWP